MKVVTTGSKYLDIDAYGGIVAYAELLMLQGEDARAVSGAPCNESVTGTVGTWPVLIDREYAPKPEDEFILIDVSDSERFDSVVSLDRVVQIIDHHPGHIDAWRSKLGDKAQIEAVGASCTQVWEAWRDAELLEQMSLTSARVLLCGILDNTLNFEALITTDRDRAAYEDLQQRAELPDNWPEVYFEECEQAILNDLGAALTNDTKELVLPGFALHRVGVGQLVIWHGDALVRGHANTITAVLGDTHQEWFANVVSIGEKRNYFICTYEPLKQWISRVLEVTFEGDIARADRLWLRKEIIKAALDHYPDAA